MTIKTYTYLYLSEQVIALSSKLTPYMRELHRIHITVTGGSSDEGGVLFKIHTTMIRFDTLHA